MAYIKKLKYSGDRGRKPNLRVASRVVATPGIWRRMNFGDVVAESEENSDDPLWGYPVRDLIYEIGSAEVTSGIVLLSDT